MIDTHKSDSNVNRKIDVPCVPDGINTTYFNRGTVFANDDSIISCNTNINSEIEIVDAPIRNIPGSLTSKNTKVNREIEIGDASGEILGSLTYHRGAVFGLFGFCVGGIITGGFGAVGASIGATVGTTIGAGISAYIGQKSGAHITRDNNVVNACGLHDGVEVDRPTKQLKGDL